MKQRRFLCASDLARAARIQGFVAIEYLPEEVPTWDKGFGMVGAILIAPDGKLYAGADPHEETTAGGNWNG